MPGPLFPVQNFVVKPYAGSMLGVSVALLSRAGAMTNDGQAITPGKTSKIVNCQIDFLSPTYKGQGVYVNLQSGANSAPLSKILMIYVDNELNSQDVTIGFPDTQQYIGIPAFTTGYYPVLTGMLQATIYNGTTGQVPVTSASQVSVIFCDFAIPGFLSQETLSITYNSSNGPVVPVIGDLTVTGVVLSTTVASVLQLLPVVAAPQTYYITGIELNCEGMFQNSQGDVPIGIILTGNGQPNILRQVTYNMRPEYENTKFFTLLDETGLNIPIQSLFLAVQDWTFYPSTAAFTIPSYARVSATITYALVTL